MHKTIRGLAALLYLITAVACTPVPITTRIEVGSNEGGRVTGGGTYQSGEEVRIEAIPNPGYTFAFWLRDDDSEFSQSRRVSFNAVASTSLRAVFEPVVIKVSARPLQSGFAQVSDPVGPEALVTITTAPQPGYVFKHWLEGSSVISAQPFLTLGAIYNRQLLAIFEPVSIQTSVTPAQAGFTKVSGPIGNEGKMTITAAPLPGYVFTHWLENNEIISTDQVKSFSATHHRQLVAVFAQGLTPINGNDILAPVSKKTTLGKFAPPDLKTIPAWITGGSNSHLLRQEALSPLIQMAEAAKEDGVTLRVVSAYRSYKSQSNIFTNNSRRYGEKKANSFSARAGQSEHQLGTTVDFGGTNSDWTAGFAKTNQGKWLDANAHRFGFILSYPLGKESITGYIYEPWHYRYVGVSTAGAITNSKLTPQQYLDEFYASSIRH